MKKRKSLLKKTLLSCLMACSLSSALAEGINIIPQPVRLEQQAGSFRLTSSAVIGYQAGLKEHAEYLQQVLSQSTGWDFRLVEGKNQGDIRLALSPDKAQGMDEGYQLDVKPGRIELYGTDKGGVFYGIQTLLQLFPAEIYSSQRQKGVDWTVPAVSVFDAPERPWRGMMLDVARYFFD